MRKILPFIICAIILLASDPGSAKESREAALAESIGKSLIHVFKPKEIRVKVRNSVPEVWIEANGCETDGVSIERIRLLAELHNDVVTERVIYDPPQLAQIIKDSVGEIVLSEKDVNEYFSGEGKNTSGFSGLQFDFQRNGFLAKGRLKTKIVFALELPLSAKGILSLRDDGVYLANTVITIEGIRQPQAVTDALLSKINPLLEFRKIPFPIKFTEITMTDTSAMLTGSPKTFKEGSLWKWNRD